MYVFMLGKQCADPGTPPGPFAVQNIPNSYEVNDEVFINCTRPGFNVTGPKSFVCKADPSKPGDVAFSPKQTSACEGESYFSFLHLYNTLEIMMLTIMMINPAEGTASN